MEQQIVLVDQMISENPDATVRDFMDLLKDIESIELAADETPVMPMVKEQARDYRGRFMGNVWVNAL